MIASDTMTILITNDQWANWDLIVATFNPSLHEHLPIYVNICLYNSSLGILIGFMCLYELHIHILFIPLYTNFSVSSCWTRTSPQSLFKYMHLLKYMNLPVHQLTELTPEFVAATNSGMILNEMKSHKNCKVVMCHM